VLLLYGQEV